MSTFLYAHPFHAVSGSTLRIQPKATRLAIEAHNGLAPHRWLGGPFNHLGTVAAARTDGKDFSFQDWAVSLAKPWVQGLFGALSHQEYLPSACGHRSCLCLVQNRSEHDSLLFSPRSRDSRHHRVHRVLASCRTIELGVSALIPSAPHGPLCCLPQTLNIFVQLRL